MQMLRTIGLLLILSAQTATGEISGTVRDSSGGVLPGVRVSITNQATGQERQVSTDANGNYSAPAMPISEYTIKAELTGFKVQIRQNIPVQVGREIRVDLMLEVGNVSEEVTVEES